MIRQATDGDMTALLKMGRAFHDASGCKWAFSDAGFADTMRGLLGQYVGMTDDGFLAGVLAQNPIAEDWTVAKEFLWWAKGSGVALRNDFREWAISSGAKEIQWSCPHENAKARAFFARSATPSEIIYSEYVACA